MPIERPILPADSWPTSAPGVASAAFGYVCTVRFRSTRGLARVRSSRWPSRARWRNSTPFRRTRPALARAVGRARRSAIGTWTFAGGGLVLEGGRRPESDCVAPLLARLPFPPAWRCVVAVPDSAPGMSGTAEAEAFANLPSPPERDVERVAHLVLMALLPALADADLATFGRALTAIQVITGRWFAPAQGGTFAPGPSGELVRRMAEWGAAGRGTELVGSRRVRHRQGRGRRPPARRTRARRAGLVGDRARGAVPHRRRARLACAGAGARDEPEIRRIEHVTSVFATCSWCLNQKSRYGSFRLRM